MNFTRVDSRALLKFLIVPLIASNTQIFLIDCMTKAISINSDAGLTICTNNDSLFVTDEDCVTAGGQATNPIFTFVPASTYFSTFNGYSSAPFTQ